MTLKAAKVTQHNSTCDLTEIKMKRELTLKELIRSVSNIVSVYAVSFMFWVSLWLNNDGPGGVDMGLLTLAAVGHLFMIALHLNEAHESLTQAQNAGE